MKNHILSTGMTLTLLGTFAPTALAETVPTMNQPDNGFYEGPNPEWAVLHSTDTRGTETHRQYHREAVRALQAWIQQNRGMRDTVAYDHAHRIVVQERNMLHRQFHTDPVAVASTPPAATNIPAVTVTTGTNTPAYHTSTGKISRRSIVAAVEERNRAHAEAR